MPQLNEARPDEGTAIARGFYPSLANLGPKSTLADLPVHDFKVPSSTLGSEVAEAFRRRPILPGVILVCPGAQLELISQQSFFKLMSQPFSLELYLKRPVARMLHSLAVTPLRLDHASDVAEAARLALNRPPQSVYEPLLIEYPEGKARILDIHVLLLAQAQLLRVAQMALVQSEKLASLGQLAAGVAHEVNNPLAFALNNVTILRRNLLAVVEVLEVYRRARDSLTGPETDTARALARIEEEQDLPYVLDSFGRLFDKTQEGLHRVRDIVKNLRDFARLDGTEVSEADLNLSLLSTLEMVGHELKERAVRVESHLGELPPVLCQPRKLNQVFLNLIMNAIQSCGGRGGIVTVRTRQEFGDVVVEVEDNGSGISPENLPRIFDPFFTTKPVGQGTGLGLPLSYGIVREHGGSIHVDSELGRGSLFRVRIPVRPAQPAKQPGQQPVSARSESLQTTQIG